MNEHIINRIMLWFFVALAALHALLGELRVGGLIAAALLVGRLSGRPR